MIINDAMRRYRLSNPTTQEDLECRWSKVPGYGDKSYWLVTAASRAVRITLALCTNVWMRTAPAKVPLVFTRRVTWFSKTTAMLLPGQSNRRKIPRQLNTDGNSPSRGCLS